MTWLPVLWADRDDDFISLLTLMAFKMNRMADCLENNLGPMEGDHKAAKELRECALACLNIAEPGEHFKAKLAYEAFEAKWGKFLHKDSKLNDYQKKLDEFGALFVRENVSSKEENETCYKDLDVYVNLECQIQKEALDNLINRLQNNMYGWWL